MDFKRRVEETRRAFDELLKSSADMLEHYVKISEYVDVSLSLEYCNCYLRVQGALELFPTAPEGLLTQTCKSLEQFQRQLDLLTLDLVIIMCTFSSFIYYRQCSKNRALKPNNLNLG